MFCSKCGNSVPDGAKFCNVCGNLLQTAEETAAAVENKAAAVETKAAETAPEFTEAAFIAKDSGEPAPEKKKMSKGLLIGLIAAGVVVLAGIIVALVLLLGGKSTVKMPLILVNADNELMTVNKLDGKEEPTILTNKVMADKDEVYYSNVSSLTYEVKISGDKSKIYFPAKSEGWDSFDLYVGDYKKMKAGEDNSDLSEKVASDVYTYRLVDEKKGTAVYLKEYEYQSGGKLFFYDLKNSEQIAKNVRAYYVSESGDRLMYTTVNDDAEVSLYIVSFKDLDNPVKVDSKIDYVTEWDDEFNTVYYLKGGSRSYGYAAETRTDTAPSAKDREDENNRRSLYVAGFEKEKEKVLDKFYDFYGINEDQTKAYYVKSRVSMVNLYDFVDDDLLASDSIMKEPTYSDYEYEETYTNYWGEISTYIATDYDAYWDAKYAYYDKEERDYLREELKETNLDHSYNDVYVLDLGTLESTLLAENLRSTDMYDIDDEMIIYKKDNAEGGSDKKFKMSDGIDFWTIYDEVYYTASDDHTTYMIVGGSGEMVIEDYIFAKAYDSEKGILYASYYEDLEDYEAELVSYTVSGNSVSDRTVITDEFNDAMLIDGVLYYSCDVDEESGDLFRYVDGSGERVATDVVAYRKYENGDEYILTDYDYDDYVIYDISKLGKNEKTKIATEVSMFTIDEDGTVIFITDFDTDDGGNLYTLDKKGEKVKIASDVLAYYAGGAMDFDSFWLTY